MSTAAEIAGARVEAGPRGITRPLSVAPMMDRTDRHFRVFARQITRGALLYTEMVTAHALARGDRAHLLRFDPVERPIALQLGGDDPDLLAECARLGVEHGYDEINLNVGCPSDRVQSGAFGACLMLRPERVAECVSAMRAAVDAPVTVKCRIGVDEQDEYADLLRFVDVVAAAGCDRFTVHARKAWLRGLSPKENRTIPPLRPEDVYRLKAERSHLVVEINGGVLDTAAALAHLACGVDAVMVGRGFYEDPWRFADADAALLGLPGPRPDRVAALRAYLPYCEAELGAGSKLSALTRHLTGVFTGLPGARRWRQTLSGLTTMPAARGLSGFADAIEVMAQRQTR